MCTGTWFISKLCWAINTFVPLGKSWHRIQRETKNAVVEMEGEDEQGNKARETPQSVDTLLKRLELSLLPSQRDAAPLDFSDIDMVCKNPRGKLPKT